MDSALMNVKDKNRRRLNENLFTKWSPEMAYVLGQFKAGANFSINRHSERHHKGQFLGITISTTNLQHLIKLQLLLRSDHRIEYNLTPLKKYKAGHIQFILNITNNIYRDDLRYFGFIESANSSPKNNAPFPKDMPKEVRPHFIRGYLDERGCPSKGTDGRPILSISGGSAEFLVELSNYIMVSVGLPEKKVYKKKSKNMKSYFIVYTGQNQIGKLFNFLYLFVPSSLYCIERYSRLCAVLGYPEKYANINVELDVATLYLLHEFCCVRNLDPNVFIKFHIGKFLAYCQMEKLLPEEEGALISQGKNVALEFNYGDSNTKWKPVFQNLIDLYCN